MPNPEESGKETMRYPLPNRRGQRTSSVIKVFPCAFGLFFATASISGCLPKQQPSATPITITLPPPLISPRGASDIGTIHAQLIIPELAIDEPLAISNGIATTQHPIAEFPQGRYTIQIVFEVDSPEFGRQTIAKGERKEDFGSRLKKVVFEYVDYTYPDSDGDHYSNLIELSLGNDPNDGNDTPRAARVFVTSSGGTGDLSTWPDAAGNTGLAAADAICQAHAERANLSGDWVAWLSDDENDAYCRVHQQGGKKSDACGQKKTPTEAGPWIRMDGYPFAPSIASLTNDFEIYTPVIFDEFSRHFSDLSDPGKKLFFGYWTGTSPYGVGPKESGLHPELIDELGNNCDNWTSASQELTAFSGIISASGPNWTYSTEPTCNMAQSLLCFEVGKHVPLPQVREDTQGLKAFVTSASGTGNLATWDGANGKTGIAAGDEICRSLAKNARLENAEHFKAFLGDDTTSAVERLVADGPWVRLDGVPLAQSKKDFPRKIISAAPIHIDGGLFTSLSVDEHGKYSRKIARPDQSAWTGTDWDTLTTPRHCSNWRSSDSNDLGGISLTTWASWTWLQDPGIALSCNLKLALYCFEDIQP